MVIELYQWSDQIAEYEINGVNNCFCKEETKIVSHAFTMSGGSVKPILSREATSMALTV